MPRETLGTSRVLVVDDNPVSREMALHVLAQLGMEGAAAEDGLSALTAHRARRFDLILMDCEMPGLDGYATTRLLRAEETGIRTPVLALTADDSAERALHCKQAGMDGVLVKPLRAPALRTALGRWLLVPGSVAPPLPALSGDDELEAVRAAFGTEFPALAMLYQRDSPPRAAALHDAHARGDAVRLAKIAHVLGGSSASIGATGLARQCLALEACAKTGTLDDVPARLAGIDAELLRVIRKLQGLLAD